MSAELIFTDAVGRHWKVYDCSITSRRQYKRSPGDKAAEYRCFVDEMSGETRAYRFPTEDTPRLPSTELLNQQLAEAQPGHPRWPHVES